MRNTTRFVTATAVIALLFQASAWGQIYRWVDEDGVVHFGQIVPEGVEATPVNVKPNSVQIRTSPKPAAAPGDKAGTPVDGAAPETGELNRAGQRRNARSERRQMQAEEAARRQRECAVMQAQKDFLEPSTRVMVQDDDGSLRRLEDSERLEGLAEANAFLAANCND